MKKIFLYLLLVTVSFNVQNAYGQWQQELWNYITFEPGDSIGPHAVIIDTVHYHHNVWQIGKPNKAIFDSAYSYPNALVTDTIHPYSPNDTSVFILTFPGLSWIISNWCCCCAWYVNVNFEYKINIDSSSIVKIEFSHDIGATWININDSISPFYGIPPPLITSSTSWNLYNFGFDLGGSIFRDSLMFKFTFISGTDTSGKEGWVIDNIGIQYIGEDVPILQNVKNINIFPNPATSELTITSPNKITQIIISNLLGQNVYNLTCNTEKVLVDVSELPSGMYFVKVNGEDVKRFMKNRPD